MLEKLYQAQHPSHISAMSEALAFASSFTLISLAELGDKTQLAIITLAAKYCKPLQIFVGAMIAFIITDGVAALIGGMMLNIFPETHIRAASGLVFIVFGLIMFRNKGEEEYSFRKSTKLILAVFGTIFISEMGDKTQLTTALLVAQFESTISVFFGVLVAMCILTVSGIFIGAKLHKILPVKFLKIISSAIFIIFGVTTFIEIFLCPK
jgi:putative Ca2+/H+ antiporter (TMEM165/GDT1 family)